MTFEVGLGMSGRRFAAMKAEKFFRDVARMTRIGVASVTLGESRATGSGVKCVELGDGIKSFGGFQQVCICMSGWVPIIVFEGVLLRSIFYCGAVIGVEVVFGVACTKNGKGVAWD